MKIRDDTRARIIRLRRQNGYSVVGIAQRLKISRLTVSNVLRGDISPLEARTTRKWLRCKELGGCVPSGLTVRRPFPMGDRDLPVCKRCEVPIRGKGKDMTWGYFEDRSA